MNKVCVFSTMKIEDNNIRNLIQYQSNELTYKTWYDCKEIKKSHCENCTKEKKEKLDKLYKQKSDIEEQIWIRGVNLIKLHSELIDRIN